MSRRDLFAGNMIEQGANAILPRVHAMAEK
jgi:hypothetical protein